MVTKNKVEAASTESVVRFCPHCESDENVALKKVTIPIGKEDFSTKTFVCKACGRYALTPEIRREMDDWGKKLAKNVVEPQPAFTETVHHFAEEMGSVYGMKRVPFFRTLTAFYLYRMVSRPDFAELKEFCAKHPSRELLAEGRSSKVSVPIRYLLYRKLETFSEVWKVPHAKAIEEAVLFGLTVLSSNAENLETLKAISENLKQYLLDVSVAA